MQSVRKLTLEIGDPILEGLPDTSNLRLMESYGRKAVKTIGQFAATDIPGLIASVLARLYPSPQLGIVLNGKVLVPNAPEQNPNVSHIDTLEIYYKREVEMGFAWNISWLYEVAEIFHRSQVVYQLTHYTKANGEGKLAIGTIAFCSKEDCEFQAKTHSLNQSENYLSQGKPAIENVLGGVTRRDVIQQDMEIDAEPHAHPKGREEQCVKYKHLLHCEKIADVLDGVRHPGLRKKIILSPAKPLAVKKTIGFNTCVRVGPDIEFRGHYFLRNPKDVNTESQSMTQSPSVPLLSSHETVPNHGLLNIIVRKAIPVPAPMVIRPSPLGTTEPANVDSSVSERKRELATDSIDLRNTDYHGEISRLFEQIYSFAKDYYKEHQNKRSHQFREKE